MTVIIPQTDTSVTYKMSIFTEFDLKITYKDLRNARSQNSLNFRVWFSVLFCFNVFSLPVLLLLLTQVTKIFTASLPVAIHQL